MNNEQTNTEQLIERKVSRTLTLDPDFIETIEKFADITERSFPMAVQYLCKRALASEPDFQLNES